MHGLKLCSWLCFMRVVVSPIPKITNPRSNPTCNVQHLWRESIGQCSCKLAIASLNVLKDEKLAERVRRK